MKTITEAISDLLYVRDTVVVPGLGAFVKKPTSAKVNRVANYFSAPSCVIEFDDDLREDNDLIVNYIVEENEVPLDEARRLLAMFVSDCFNKLKNGEKVNLIGIGTLRYDWNSDIVIEQDPSSNFNSDAFGLSDFTAVPMTSFKGKDEIKAEIEQQQWEKNTPVTVDEKAVHENDDEDNPRRRVWPWILLVLALLAGLLYGLQYFRIIDLKQWLKPQSPIVMPLDTVVKIEKPIEPAPIAIDSVSERETDSVALPETDTLVHDDTLQVVEEQPINNPVLNVETDPVVEPAPVEEVNKVEEEAKILVVVGCFSNEEYAQIMFDKLKDQGFEATILEKHNGKWFVSYGRYKTNDEALAALRKIRAEGYPKAWIRQ